MKYKEITVNTTTDGSDLVSMVLYECGSDGVSIYDSKDILDLIKSDIIWDYIEPDVLKQSPIVKVKGFYSVDNFSEIYTNVVNSLEDLKLNSPFELGSLEVQVNDLDDADWVNEWKKYYKPIHVGNIVIVPKWIKYDAKDNEKIVLIDPGMAFGTGSHESTRLCLELFSELNSIGKNVLDIGAGSGILGITASICGAEKVLLSDIAPLAVKACKENAELNNIQNAIITEADLIANATIKGDIVFANITADILIMLSDNIGSVLNNNGYIILSGIIHKRYDEVLKAYLDKGYLLDKSVTLGEWCGIRLKKKN